MFRCRINGGIYTNEYNATFHRDDTRYTYPIHVDHRKSLLLQMTWTYQDGRLAGVNLATFSIICFIVGRLDGSAPKQFWMRFHVLSSIFGLFSRSGSLPFVMHQAMWNTLFPSKGTLSKNVYHIRVTVSSTNRLRDSPHNKGSQTHTRPFAPFASSSPC